MGIDAKNWLIFTNLGQGLSQKLAFVYLSSQCYELAFLKKCWLIQTRNPPLTLFLSFWLLYFYNFVQILFKRWPFN